MPGHTSRGAYNLTCDFFLGPLSFFPGFRYRTAVPCRLVPQNIISLTLPVFSLRRWWLTCDTPPQGPQSVSGTGPVATFTWGFGDSVALVTGGPATHWVIFTENVALGGALTYTRTSIALLPRP
jgi:hypothetical protein